jgi:hypothetical protein
MILRKKVDIKREDRYLPLSELLPFQTDQVPTMLLSLANVGTMGASWEISHPTRIAFFKSIGVDYSRVRALKQVHSRDIVYAPNLEGEQIVEGDGLYTDDSRYILSVTVADCLPIFMYHVFGKGFGVVHSGWQGTGIVEKEIEALRDRLRVPSEEIGVVIGPGIGSCCYAVDKERAAYFYRSFGFDPIRRNGKYYLDLVQVNVDLLQQYDLASVLIIDHCTSCEGTMGSYRREGAKHFTRMIALIGFF